MSSDLRPCPFCANDRLTVATFGNEQVVYTVVTCTECGAMGPRASGDEPPGHAEHLWNQRFGVGVEHYAGPSGELPLPTQS